VKRTIPWVTRREELRSERAQEACDAATITAYREQHPLVLGSLVLGSLSCAVSEHLILLWPGGAVGMGDLGNLGGLTHWPKKRVQLYLVVNLGQRWTVFWSTYRVIAARYCFTDAAGNNGKRPRGRACPLSAGRMLTPSEPGITPAKVVGEDEDVVQLSRKARVQEDE
jgi:hypothetical protein